MMTDEPAGRIAARVVTALPRRARIRVIACVMIGGLISALVAASLVAPLAISIVDGATLDAAVLFLTPLATAAIALAARSGRRRP